MPVCVPMYLCKSLELMFASLCSASCHTYVGGQGILPADSVQRQIQVHTCVCVCVCVCVCALLKRFQLAWIVLSVYVLVPFHCLTVMTAVNVASHWDLLLVLSSCQRPTLRKRSIHCQLFRTPQSYIQCRIVLV